MSDKAANRSKYIGLDVGTARIGVAVSDPDGTIAMPHETLRAGEDAVDKIVELVNQRDVEVIAVGWPIRMDGSETAGTDRTNAFIERLEDGLDQLSEPPAIRRVDERLSSSAADHVLREADATSGRRKDAVDKLAATRILKTLIEKSELSHDP